MGNVALKAKAAAGPRDNGGLSRLGRRNADWVKHNLKVDMFGNQYDPVTNPDGIVILGVADNALMRDELVEYFNADRLKLRPSELNYGDRLFATQRLVKALCNMFNKVPVGLSKEKPKVIREVTMDHIVVGSGATGILDALFSILCNPHEGVLLSVPYYNGFDHDLTARSEVKIVEVKTALPNVVDADHETIPSGPSPAFAPDTVKDYQRALEKAKADGQQVKAILVCNPHNPTGLVYPRETLVELARLAAKEDLHLVVDEIYAHSVFESRDIPAKDAQPFETILSIDVEKEAGLSRGKVHVVTSASKDFGVNGFRLGVYVNQGNEDAISAMSGLAFLASGSSPAGALWYTWLEDEEFLKWYFAENHRRLSGAYHWVTDWARHHKIPYVASNSGHFILLDFSAFLKDHQKGDSSDQRGAEGNLTGAFFKEGVFIAPGAIYHHPIPGWFRLTISQSPLAIKTGLARVEKVLGLRPHAPSKALFDLHQGMLPLPPSLHRIKRQQIDPNGGGAPKPTLTDLPDDNQLLSAITRGDVQTLVGSIREAPARKAHKLLSAIAHNSLLVSLAQPSQIDQQVDFLTTLVREAQGANSQLRGIEREAKYFESEITSATGAGEVLLEHYVAELHTAISSLSTNSVTPQFEHQGKEDAPEPAFWLRSFVYGAVLGKLFTYPEARPRTWRAVQDLLIKGIFSTSTGAPALGTVVLVPTLLLTSSSSIKSYLENNQGNGKDYIWYDDKVSKANETWNWNDIVKSMQNQGLHKALIASVGKVVPNQATSTWELAIDRIAAGQLEDQSALNVRKSFQWVFDLQQ
ncbi:unnamed protein product [Sympodiomycopsis kandeliae]